ncbi:NADH dehydrogenase subunit C [Salipiger mucosus DSM 16094]|uniref:NADH dehydrogenase subunit C n=2 Tax=Salipiger mucosus TaxID=263378 RepID=S9QKY4_9RHOB|nr:NADH dehydrogenase subunit C [Salipiger mucosus DSM 16094]
MGGGGLIWLIVLGVLVVVPFWRLLPQFGIPAWVSLVAIIPLGALILLWVMAFKDKTNGGTA